MERSYQILNSGRDDLSTILTLYDEATEYMRSKDQVAWPTFSEELISQEIQENKQWKLIIDDKIACIWATTLHDELIWGKEHNDPAVYIHRIATHPDHRGNKLVRRIVEWADDYCKTHQLKYVRMDTVGLNQGLIHHYTTHGFEFLGTRTLKNTSGLPAHYNLGPVCLFQRIPDIHNA